MDVKQTPAAGDLVGAGARLPGMRLPGTRFGLRRSAGLVVLAAVFAACGGSGLSSAEWIWCKENAPAVDAAAATLQIATVERTFKEPTWWQDYQTSVLSLSNAALMANPDFTASCTAAQVKAGVDPHNVAWCTADGIGEIWDAAISLALMTNVEADTFAYRMLPLQQRINDADFDRACKTAYAVR